VYGYGATRADAARDAEINVKQESVSRFGRDDCYTPVLPSDCKDDGNGWVCVANVANHEGSCGNRTVRRSELPNGGPSRSAGPPASAEPLPQPLPGERLELAWFVTRVDEIRDVDAAGPLQMTASQAKAERLRRDAAARQRYGSKTRIVLGITSDSYPCAFLFQMAGSSKYGFSSNTTSTANADRANQSGQLGSAVVSGPACRP
jgi:hypothetical protein